VADKQGIEKASQDNEEGDGDEDEDEEGDEVEGE
jgi:hypothetical protein